MAAYAALLSLMNIMESIQNHPRLSTAFDKNQIESLGEKINFLLDFIELYNSQGSSKEEAADLEGQIASAAYAAEDEIESHIVDQIRAGSTEESFGFSLDLLKIIGDMDSIKENVMKVKKERRFIKDLQPTYLSPAASSRLVTTGKTTMVGFDDNLMQLLDMLTGEATSRQIIPITGMGGIGKTTLARNIYEHPLIVWYFDVRAWATISQGYSVTEILLQLLSCLGESTDKIVGKKENELGKRLSMILWGRRYLIILDDMWDIEAWNKINSFFPDNCNGSRIIVTTRLSNLAYNFGSSGLVLNFLDEDKSWNLFCEKVFGREGCPLELEETGKRVVERCRGLPLSIVVIGGILGKSSRQREYWEYIAENISSIVNSEEDNQYQNILSLSYSHLPAHLKPCFLYMGLWPEDQEIRVSQQIKLWVAEGFVKQNVHQSLEDTAEGYIRDLVERNLILVRSVGSSGKFKTCQLHDLVRDLCLRIAENEKFFCVRRVLRAPEDENRERRIIIPGSTEEKYCDPQLFHPLESTPLARTLICKSPTLLSFKSRLLRVLIEVYSDSLDTTFQQINLRFLAYKSVHAPIGWIHTYKLPSSISLLWNMQTLIIDKSIAEVVAPSGIWKLPQLRHLQLHRICLPDPPPSDKQDDFVLQNLQTLGTVLNFKCSEEVCMRLPNIKKLRVFYDDFSGEGKTSSRYSLYLAGFLNKLESLYCGFHTVPDRQVLLQNLNFPSSLKKLVLESCELHWNDLTIIGSLPHLVVLKLKCQSVRGREWCPAEGEFLHLKFLEIDSCYLIKWKADSYHFPVLENLVLCRLYRLIEIPSRIGDILTLHNICVVDCSVSAAISASRILHEQESFGNDLIQVRVRFREQAVLDEFLIKMEREGCFSSKNLHIDGLFQGQEKY